MNAATSQEAAMCTSQLMERKRSVVAVGIREQKDALKRMNKAFRMFIDKHALAAIKLKLELANIERQQQKEALQIRERKMTLKKEEAALRKEEQEREAAIKKEQQEREVALKEREMALLQEKFAILTI
ncbi:U2 small nuclear ribonucleoprotein auxiliary factor 35 kDa subunit-related protein 2-like [Procambarus clarkii]|uniref:U2 small nuclear ribonucleoprotein auxiliary factor 35 kDa subunit-related protein 2-like n=1 Tax=Procambarus clarkii TaxID=6728 RepID=UPI0037438F2A